MAPSETGSLEHLLRDGWEYHDEDADRLARELEAHGANGVPANALAPFVHLCTHAIGEHLGDWGRALRLGKRVLDGQTPMFETARAWGRLYVAAVLAGDALTAVDLEFSYLEACGEDFGLALLDMRFMLASALVCTKRVHDAARIYRAALNLAERIRESPVLDRTIAVASNNLGWELYEMPARTEHEDGLMRLCAETSLAFWLKCGDWVNEERALYLKAVVANATGDPRSGLRNADAGLAIIAANGDRPLDAALLQLARALSLAAVGDDDSARAISEADAIASRLTETRLTAQFMTQRAKVLAALA
jgi:hypothetical protein